ncbi:MAG TPA: glycosyltransferase family 9 protein [Candidatus Cybelea sp.]|nr:glycosyltransferase family 9 protein [Candidatus Cybelea sp.]
MNVLFVTSNRIGDAVLSTGLLAHIAAEHPEARVTVACGPAPAALFAGAPNVARVIAVPKRRYALHWLRLWTQTVGNAWDLVVDVRGSALAYLLIARDRRMLSSAGAHGHQVERLARVLGLANAPSPKLWTSERDRSEARRLVPDGGPVLAIGPTANWGGKQWPAQSFAETVRRITAPGGMMPGARVAVFGADNERIAAEPVLATIAESRRIDLVGGIGLLTAYACLERCAFYIGNDSGLMHMAAASGIPTLGLFGPSREELYGPWGANAAAVRTPESYDQILHRPGYDYRKHDSYMASLTVDSVIAAAEVLWRRVREAA